MTKAFEATSSGDKHASTWNRFAIVYFLPNPIIEWKVPVALFVRGKYVRQIRGTIPEHLRQEAGTLLYSVLGQLLFGGARNSDTRGFSQIPEYAGPHFELGEWLMIPPNVNEEAWLMGLLR